MKDPKAAKEWFSHGQNDLLSARLILKEGGPLDTASVLIQQAVEKYLKGYLIFHGWELIKTHDLAYLIGEAAKYDQTFLPFTVECRKISQYYREQRYPIGVESKLTLKEVKASLKVAEKLIEKITAAIS